MPRAWRRSIDLLDCLYVFVVLIGGVVAQDVHVEPGALLDHGQADPAGADDGNRLSGNFIAEKGKVRMPIAPLVFPRQVFRGPQSFRASAPIMKNANSAVASVSTSAVLVNGIL